MNYELIALIVFVAVIGIFLLIKRKNIEVQKLIPFVLYFVLYKTKVGLKLMDRFSKHEKLLKIFSIIAVVVGFIGMGAICVLLVYNLYKIAFFPAAVSGVGIVLPIKAKGVFYVPFFYWIISILIVASVHEFSHGMIARFRKIRIKSSGFAFLALVLPIIPAAFVEPDEKELKKKKTRHQLEVFAAGPFINIVFGFIFLGILMLIGSPIVGGMMNFNGANITELSNSSVLLNTGIAPGDLITGIDGAKVTYVEDFTAIMQNKSPGEQINIETNKANYSVKLAAKAEDSSKAYMGVFVTQASEVKPGFAAKYGTFIPKAILWILGLFWWLYLLNVGIGIFNLVPVGPIDGGRMVYVSLLKRFKEAKAKTIANWISIIFLMVIILNVVAGFVL